jgi:hypothetical protein
MSGMRALVTVHAAAILCDGDYGMRYGASICTTRVMEKQKGYPCPVCGRGPIAFPVLASRQDTREREREREREGGGREGQSYSRGF